MLYLFEHSFSQDDYIKQQTLDMKWLTFEYNIRLIF